MYLKNMEWIKWNKDKKKKNGIMILKGNEDRIETERYPVIKEYKYLGNKINNKMKINKYVCNIDKKIGEYFTRNYVLNKRYFSVKSIMLIFYIFINQDYYMVCQYY